MTKAKLDSYRIAKEMGLLTKRREDVFLIIKNNGPISMVDIVKEFTKTKTLSTEGSISGRLSELRQMDLIEECGEKHNAISGMKNTLYRVTDRAPKPLLKRETRAELEQRLNQRISNLQGVLRYVARTSREPLIICRVTEALGPS